MPLKCRNWCWVWYVVKYNKSAFWLYTAGRNQFKFKSGSIFAFWAVYKLIVIWLPTCKRCQSIISLCCACVCVWCAKRLWDAIPCLCFPLGNCVTASLIMPEIWFFFFFSTAKQNLKSTQSSVYHVKSCSKCFSFLGWFPARCSSDPVNYAFLSIVIFTWPNNPI